MRSVQTARSRTCSEVAISREAPNGTRVSGLGRLGLRRRIDAAERIVPRTDLPRS